ncbi:GTP pyrophosphokinase [Minicystis rosea]|nr:GTP pyrophosphokinase [Minicystis rosea]
MTSQEERCSLGRAWVKTRVETRMDGMTHLDHRAVALSASTAAIVEELGAPEACVAAARALASGADALSVAARRALAVRWHAGGRTPAAHAIEAISAIAGDARVITVAAAFVLARLRAEDGADEAPSALSVWAPLAARHGLGPLQREIEDLAFKRLDRAAYDAVVRFVAERRKERDRAVAVARGALLETLSEAGFEADVTGRAKHLYSIHQKLRARGDRGPVLHDLFGLRVIVADEAACYAALGAIHAAFAALPDRFKDYIVRPKPSGYRALHTCVDMAGVLDRSVEIQIRSRAMHAAAEHGAASHVRYKNLDGVKPAAGLWVYALTPRGEVRRLPRGATPLDFAYAIHTAIGRRYLGARVMGRMVPVDTPLETGDVVEILCSARARPSKGQLARVRTARARNRIRAALQRGSA